MVGSLAGLTEEVLGPEDMGENSSAQELTHSWRDRERWLWLFFLRGFPTSKWRGNKEKKNPSHYSSDKCQLK